jgi:hypothetical protein
MRPGAVGAHTPHSIPDCRDAQGAGGGAWRANGAAPSSCDFDFLRVEEGHEVDNVGIGRDGPSTF